MVEEVFEYGRPYKFGLEAGSKPELLAVLAIADNDTPIICNGFKDDEYIEMVMLAKKIGRRIIPVVEKYTELDLILKHSAKVGVRPVIGLRIKLASRGSGRWKSSGGYRSKFGLTVTEALRALEQLKAAGMEDCLQLLHFHLGSQITNIRQIKAAVMEAGRVYVELKRAGAGLCYMDVGGGLGIDYDGSQTDFESSVNYTLQEYANDVVYHIQSVCDEAEVPHPTIVSESGRAVAAYHSVLVFNVLGVTGFGDGESMPEIPDDVEQPLIDLKETLRGLSNKNLLESFHDAQQALDSALNLFSLGYLPLQQRSWAESIYWVICRRIQKLAKELDYFPEELEGLDGLLSDTYFCNFSLFQSMPDSWAVKQLFPIMPIHRLDEEPFRHGILGDISCDSDGKVDQFIDRRDVKKTLPLHTFNGEPYCLGAFLVGAYQEILGDLHNLFGDTNAVHVSLDEKGAVVLEAVIQGDTVREVLDYVQFQSKALLEQFRKDVEMRRARRPHRLRRIRPAAAVLRRRVERVYLPGAVTLASPSRSIGACLLFTWACAAQPGFNLPDDVIPRKHTIELTIDPGKDTFSGEARIDVELRKPTTIIWLNAKDITPLDASVGSRAARAETVAR